MFIEINDVNGLANNFSNRSSLLNMHNIDFIYFDEKEMLVKNGKPISHKAPTTVVDTQLLKQM